MGAQCRAPTAAPSLVIATTQPPSPSLTIASTGLWSAVAPTSATPVRGETDANDPVYGPMTSKPPPTNTVSPQGSTASTLPSVAHCSDGTAESFVGSSRACLPHDRGGAVSRGSTSAVVDSTVAFMGSQNLITPSYLKPKNIKAGRAWKDLNIKLTGEIVTSLELVFAIDWFSESARPPRGALETEVDRLSGVIGRPLKLSLNVVA